MPPKLSINSFHLDSVHVNPFPHLASSGYRIKRLVGVSVVCAERKDTPQQNPASAYFSCVVLLSERHFRCGLWLQFYKCQQVSEILSFPLIVLSDIHEKDKAHLATKKYRLLRKKIHAIMCIMLYGVARLKKVSKKESYKDK